jgi:alpha-tubulin suppressor-like RCC1 family protein
VVLLTSKNEIYCFGQNIYYQCCDPTNTLFYNPIKSDTAQGILKDKKIIKITAGYYFTLFLTEIGKKTQK